MSSTQGLTPHAFVQLRPGMGMHYTDEIIDRMTGELVSVSKGNWITIAELAELFGVGRRQASTILREMDFLVVVGSGKNSRHQIAPWVSARGWGQTNRRMTDKYPFDVISPEAVQWISERWSKAAAAVRERTHDGPVAEAASALEDFKTTRDRNGMSVEGQARWLIDHFPHLTHQQISDVLSVTRQVIDRYMKVRQRQLAVLLAMKRSYREPVGSLPEGCLGPIRKNATPLKMTA
jgi:hypothetical protein